VLYKSIIIIIIIISTVVLVRLDGVMVTASELRLRGCGFDLPGNNSGRLFITIWICTKRKLAYKSFDILCTCYLSCCLYVSSLLRKIVFYL